MSMEVPQYVPREERRAGGAKFDVPDGEYWCKIVSAGEETVKNTSERVLTVEMQVKGQAVHYIHWIHDNAAYDARHSDVLDTFGIAPSAGRLYSQWIGRIGLVTFEHYKGKDGSQKCRMAFPNPHIKVYTEQNTQQAQQMQQAAAQQAQRVGVPWSDGGQAMPNDEDIPF